MVKRTIKIAILFFSVLIFASYCPNCNNKAFAQNTDETGLNISCKSAYLIDARTGTQVYSKNATEQLPIASMTKLATLAVIFDQISKGVLQPTDTILVSQNAASTEGSSAFLDAGSKYSVEALIKTIVMVSANDSCVALAEYISGSEQLFADKMNNLISELKLENTHFTNSTGLPSDNHYSCAKDMAKIYLSICNNNLYKKFSKIWMEDFVHPSGRVTGLVNTNRLIKNYDGCNGGKTGHTTEAKYCLTASATRGDTTLVSVIIGAPDSKARFEQTKQMFNYGFANYTSKVVVDTNIPLAEINISGANQKTVIGYAKNNYIAFCKKGDNMQYKTHIVADKGLCAPVKAGDKIGTLLVLDQNNIVLAEIDIITNSAVEKREYKQILHDIFTAW